MSKDGKSFAFDSRANGFGRGEGVATLIIKRLSDALAARDPVRAVIRETLLNQDGKKDSLTSPSKAAQAALMRDCYEKARLDPHETSYFEAHGTGTAIGDPIEAAAIAAVFRSNGLKDHPLRIGSVKTNIGHTEVTSGLAAIVKVILAMEKGIIPPSVNFDIPNAEIALDSSNLQVVTKAEHWAKDPFGFRRASINNFGAGGTNAHVILENAAPMLSHGESPPLHEDNGRRVLVLSARTEAASKSSVSALSDYLQNQKDTVNGGKVLLESVTYTLGQHRTLFSWIASHRISISQGIDHVVEALNSPSFQPVHAPKSPRIGMIFTGQGAQWHAMGRELITAFPSFKASLAEGQAYLKELGAEWVLMDELDRDVDSTKVNDTAKSIPICVALQISLVRLLHAWGIRPAAVASHSSGEIAAAYTVGAIDYRSAMAIAYYRAMLTADHGHRNGAMKGGMIALGIGAEDAEPYLDQLQNGTAVVACINSPLSVTIAGDVSAVEEIKSMADAGGVFARRLRVDTAYHSHHMEPVAEPYRQALYNHHLQPGDGGDVLESMNFHSAVTGDRIIDAEELAQPEHWVSSLVQPVRFVEAVSSMILGDFDPTGTSVDVIIEVGPHNALEGPFKENLELPEYNGLQLPYYCCLLRKKSAIDSMQDLASGLLQKGHSIDLRAVNYPSGEPSDTRVLTNLPSYPWDHKVRHWHESRFNKALRTRTQPPNEHLGALDPWANPIAPSWRQKFRADEAPWVRDHIIDSNILYPAAGFVCRAIEAYEQMLKLESDDRNITAYCLRDVNFQQALVVPEFSDGTHIHTALTAASDKAIGYQGWMQFIISSFDTTNEAWTQHASGMISANNPVKNDIPSTSSPHADRDIFGNFPRSFNVDDFYGGMRESGIKYGVSFKNITKVVQSRESKQSRIEFCVGSKTLPKDSLKPPFIHPTTLDSIIQAAYTTLEESDLRKSNLRVPQSIAKLWISDSLSNEPGNRFTALSSCRRNDARSIQVDTSVIQHCQQISKAAMPDVQMEGLVLMSIGAGGRNSEQLKSEPWLTQLCNKVEWVPDPTMATEGDSHALKQIFSCPPDPHEADVIMNLRRVCVYFIQDALSALTESEVEQLDGHMKKYYAWLQNQLMLATEGKLGPNSAEWPLDEDSTRRKYIGIAVMSSVNGEMVCRLGPHLSDMLRRIMAPLELMMEEKLLYKYYSNILKADRSFRHAAMLSKRLVHKNPRSRILEIGAGTGGQTRHALKALGTAHTGGAMAALYHFTDISAAFFETAAAEFAEWSDVMQYDKLDIEKEPDSQGFELASYDIIIACQVLHATRSIFKTMENVRKLLKPGGRILLVETTKDQVDVQFIFGLLPGWWLSEESERTLSPSLSVASWDRFLKSTGFTGIDFEVHDCESEEMYSISTIMSTAASGNSRRLVSEEIVIVTSDQALPPDNWLESLGQLIAASSNMNSPSIAVQILESSSPAVYAGKMCVFLGDVSRSVLRDPSETEMNGIKAMATSCKGLLWVTYGGAVNCEHPDQGLAVGFMRTLRNEYVGRKLMTLDLDPAVPAWSQSSMLTIAKILEESFANTNDTLVYDEPSEFEYAERNGFILIPRLEQDVDRNQLVLPEPVDYTAKDIMQNQLLHQAEYPLSLQVGMPGLLDTIMFDHDLRPSIRDGNRIAENFVQIEPKAYGVNFRDVMVALAQLDDRTMGLECAGIVTRAGAVAASNGFNVGDRVLCLLEGPFASRVCTEWTNVVGIPPNLTFEEAATIPVVFSTAFIGLCNIARLKRGQSVLINAAAGGVGQAAIMIAQHIGADIFVTLSSPEKAELIIGRYGIPRDRVFSSRDASFVRAVLSATAEQGVDVVLNSLAGRLLQASFDVVAPFGHFVEIGARDIERNASLEMRPFTRQVSFSSVNLLSMMRHRQHDVQHALTDVVHLLTERSVTPVWPITTYSIADAAHAFRQLMTGKSTGKIVLTIGEKEIVPVIPRPLSVRFSPDASYLLVGGIGGIGQSVMNWMIEKGAKNIVLLSRSANKLSTTAQLLAKASQEAECQIKAVSCDVSDAAHLKSALQECRQQGFPPIRGIIQAAMVLKVCFLYN